MTMRDECTYLVGIDIGGTKCAVSLGEYRESDACPVSLTDKIRFDTNNKAGHADVIRRILDAVRELLARRGLEHAQIAAAGISCGGPLDSEAGLILSPPNLIGWDRVPIVEIVERETGIRTYLQNDANACALAEWKFGAARGAENAVFLTFGTGLGAGLILGGRLYGGTNGNAGEIGHIRLSENGPVGYGKSGSFEGFCSGGGILQIAKTMVLERLQMGESVPYYDGTDASIDARQMELRAREGDALALAVYAKCGEYLGRGLSVLVDTLNPQVIVIGSIFTHCSDLIWPHAKAVMDRECLAAANSVCRVVPAELGGQIGDYAAVAVAASAI